MQHSAPRHDLPILRTAVEPLERRLLMDGDVTATFRGGDLTVRGDDADNQVVVAQLAPKMVRVTGLGQTTINGASFVDFPYAVDDVRVNARQGGEDRVAVRGPIRILGGITARLGDGELVVEGSSGPVNVAEGVNLRGGEAGDVHLRNEVLVGGNVNVATGGAVNAAAGLGIVPDFAAATFSDPLNIDNPYFPLVVGTTYTYEERSVDEDTGDTVVETILVEVLNETRTVAGVETRVIRDRVFVEGLLIEDTVDWHAQDDNGNVWYFGEETTDFEYDEDGNLIGSSTFGSFEAGVDGARAGIVMEAVPRVGDRYYQEVAPGVALDQGEVLAVGETTTLPGLGTFDDLVRTKDTTVISPDALEHKLYAPGIGFIREFKFDFQSGEVDGDLRLISVTLNGEPVTQVVSPDGFTGVNVTGKGTGPIEVHGETLIRAGGVVVLLETRFADEVEIFGEETVSVVDAAVEDLTVRAADAVGLRNLTASEEVSVRTETDAYLFNSRFTDEVSIRLGGGDNELVVEGSTIAELEADGGGGDDVFDDRGDNDILELELTRFEEEADEE